MMNHIGYALSRYLYWLAKFSVVVSIIAVYSLARCTAVLVVLACFVLSFFIPFGYSYIGKKFKIRNMGKSNVEFAFGDLYNGTMN